MKRGLPRPLIKVDTFEWHTDPDPKWIGRRFPMPYTSREEDIGLIHDGRAKECVDFRKCFVCGNHVDGTPWVLYKDVEGVGSDHGEAGPYHKVCLDIAMKMCPHIAEGPYLAVQMPYDELEQDTKGIW